MDNRFFQVKRRVTMGQDIHDPFHLAVFYEKMQDLPGSIFGIILSPLFDSL
jgi:hypothetical protein